MGALLIAVAVPPLSVVCAFGAALFRDRGGSCKPCGRWSARLDMTPGSTRLPVGPGA
ncbi:MAG: hypothetical protein JWR70_773 [Modestobacter sp.]|jgi:hypothetical protein|nr:hypothetical protein [Modestobacter sp.]